MTMRNNKDHLNGLFYNIYDIDSIGARPQQNVVEALMAGDVFVFDPDTVKFTVSKDLMNDAISNLFATSIIARIFDPAVYSEPSLADIAPPEYLGADCERLKWLRKDLEAQKRAGRSFALRSLAGFEAVLDRTELTETEAENIAPALSAKYGIASSAEKCISFLDGMHDVINYGVLGWRDDCLKESERQARVFWDAVYKFWSAAGREERTLYHAAKLNLINEITDAVIRKARSLDLNPDQFARNDPEHAEYWRKTFNEDVPMPYVLLSRSRIVANDAINEYKSQQRLYGV